MVTGWLPRLPAMHHLRRSSLLQGLMLALALLLHVSLHPSLYAQPTSPTPSEALSDEDAVEKVLEDALEDALEETGEAAEDDPELADELERYRRRRINLYTTTADSLARLPGISMQEARAILDFIDSAAPATIGQLEAIEGIDADQLQVLRSYTSLRRQPVAGEVEPLEISMRTRIHQGLQPRRGYTDRLTRIRTRRDPASGDSLGLDTISLGSLYLGHRAGLLVRLLATGEGFSGGVTFEKDPGEPIFFTDTTSLSYARNEHVDETGLPVTTERRFGGFLSAHASLRFGRFSLHLGDYLAEFGQGLLFWGSSGGSKGGEVIQSPHKIARGITGYRSAAESSYLRGAAIGFHQEGMGVSGIGAYLFWSSPLLDASFEERTNSRGEQEVHLASIREDGYRRTRNEIRQSGNLRERLFGGNIQMRFRGGDVGITAYTAAHDPAAAGSLGIRGIFGGTDRSTMMRTTMVSLDGRYARWGAMLFGELARATDGTIGALGGIATAIGKLDVIVAGRWLPPEFTTPHGRGFGEGPTKQRNERGMYIAAKGSIVPGLVLSAYLDLYNFPAPTPAVPFPRDGADGYLAFDYQPARGLKFQGRLRSEVSQRGITITDSFGRDRKRIVEESSTGGRLTAEYLSPGGAFRLRARLERRFIGSSDGIPASDGMLTFVEFRLRPHRTISFGARGAIFDTDDFDAAIYAAEQDLPGRLTNLPFYGEGRRLYLYANWSPFPACSIAAKYAETVYSDRSRISPGTLQEINGTVDNMVALQVEVKM